MRMGCFTAADVTKDIIWCSPSHGRVVVGRTRTTEDSHYGSVKLDELMLFNTALTEEQIQGLTGHA